MYVARPYSTREYNAPPRGSRRSTPDSTKHTAPIHTPKKMNQNTLPGSAPCVGCCPGMHFRAMSAVRVIERDFLYSAGFQIGRPNGCSKLSASCRSLSVYSRSSLLSSSSSSPSLSSSSSSSSPSPSPSPSPLASSPSRSVDASSIASSSSRVPWLVAVLKRRLLREYDWLGRKDGGVISVSSAPACTLSDVKDRVRSPRSCCSLRSRSRLRSRMRRRMSASPRSRCRCSSSLRSNVSTSSLLSSRMGLPLAASTLARRSIAAEPSEAVSERREGRVLTLRWRSRRSAGDAGGGCADDAPSSNTLELARTGGSRAPRRSDAEAPSDMVGAPNRAHRRPPNPLRPPAHGHAGPVRIS